MLNPGMAERSGRLDLLTPPTPPGQADARACSCQLRHRALQVDVGIVAGHSLLGTLHRSLGSIKVDILGPLRGVREDHGLVAKDLQEAAGDRQVLFFATGPELEEPRRQLGQQRRMAREYRQLPINARRDEYVHVAGVEFFFSRYYF